MPLYFYVLDHAAFHERLHPALTASWLARSFAPCRTLCADLEPEVEQFKTSVHLGAEEMLITQVGRGLTFDRRYWRLLIGELLLVCAVDIPEIETSAETLTCLLAAGSSPAEIGRRGESAAIQQAHFGSRDLTFGTAYYRPEHVGWNDLPDVGRLAHYLGAVDAARWHAADLAALPGFADDAERAEELDYVREWFPALVHLYHRALRQRNIIVCERL